jgi:hypothetical protein
MMRFNKQVLFFLLVSVLALSGPVLTASAGQVSFVFKTFDVPKQDFTQLMGVNEFGEVVGNYGTKNLSHGFIKTRTDPANQVTTIDVANSSFTTVLGVNRYGDVVGRYLDQKLNAHGFMKLAGQAIMLYDAFGAPTEIFGINKQERIVGDTFYANKWVGFYKDPNGNPMLKSYGSSTTFANVDFTGTFIGGSFTDLLGIKHGFLAQAPFDQFPFRIIDFPGAAATQAFGLDDALELVGSYIDFFTGKTHGFLLDGNGNFSTIDFPGATSTTARGIARIGPRRDTIEIVGYYTDANGKTHGFSAMVPEPSTATLSGIALVLLASCCWIAGRGSIRK